MCGFVGGTDPDWQLDRALDTLVHRGPDAAGTLQQGPFQVGFRRLKIIDLQDSANQPMRSSDGHSWIVFNGEIYGYQKVRQELEAHGHSFKTDSDTEVALTAYRQWGNAFVDHIDGMFAIAIWDDLSNSLTHWRDRPGIKPLYYFFDGARFAFASELKALQALVGAENLTIDETALYDFLSYRYIPTPKTMYRECRKLAPGHRLRFHPSGTRLEEPVAYWRLRVDPQPARANADDAADEIKALIETSVAEQMVADVPLGFFLSGGIDSSVVVASAATIHSANPSQPISTFAIGFDSDEVSETPYARQIAQLFDSQHHERILLADAAGDLMKSLKPWFDEPFADESSMPTYLVAKTAREKVTVVLTGDGGDEVFGGYRTYPRFQKNARPPQAPRCLLNASGRLRGRLGTTHGLARLMKLLELRFSDGPELWGLIMSGMATGEKAPLARQLGIPRDYDDWWFYRQHWRPELPPRTRLQFLDFHTFLPELVLTKVDRTTMAVSLEARVPLLAQRIIEFAFGLPEDVRFLGGELKGLLKHAYRDVLPPTILNRRKKGFGIPRHYLRGVAAGKPIQAHILSSLFAGERAATARIR